jgi:hypothetical protein
VVELANTGRTLDAANLAKYGKELSLEEKFVCNHYLAEDELEAVMKKAAAEPTPSPFSFMEVNKSNEKRVTLKELDAAISRAKTEEKNLCMMFIDAVNRHDGERIMNIAKAVWFFKDKRHESTKSIDRQRALLLFLKEAVKEPKVARNIGEIARLVGAEDHNQDGFSSLRRKCKEIGLAIAPSRKIRK